MYDLIDTSGEGLPQIKSKPLSEIGFDLNIEQEDIIVEESTTSEETVDAAIFTVHTGATYDRVQHVRPVEVSFIGGAVSFESSDTDVLTIDEQTGTVTRVSDGTARVIATNKYIKRAVRVTVQRYTTASTSVFSRWVADTLPFEATAAIDPLLVPGKDTNIFSVIDHSTPTYQYNSDCWAAGYDFSCVSVWNSNLGPRQCGTLITPRHVVFAHHYRIEVGSILRFVKKSDNSVVTRTLIARKSIPDSDITVGVLDEDVPEGISFAKIVPGNVGDYLSPISIGIPCLGINQFRESLVFEFDGIYSGGKVVYFRLPTNETRRDFTSRLITGDSGCPGFIAPLGSLDLLTTWTSPTSGPFYGQYVSELNAAIDDLGSGGYTVTVADYSEFPTYT